MATILVTVTPSHVLLHRMSGSSYGILSTVHLDGKAKDSGLLSSELLRLFSVSPYETPTGEDREDQALDAGGCKKMVVFLPPCYHLLLKFDTTPTSTTVAIATDNWRLLPLVNTFLHAGPG